MGRCHLSRWIATVCLGCIPCSMAVSADELAPAPHVTATALEIPQDEPQDPNVKHVSKLSTDDSNEEGGAGKYIMAASAVVVGTVAIILASKSGGKHPHHSR